MFTVFKRQWLSQAVHVTKSLDNAKRVYSNNILTHSQVSIHGIMERESTEHGH